MAKYVGKEAALVFAMGYDTNASVLPALMGKGDLIISDCLNHTSIVNGARAANTQVSDASRFSCRTRKPENRKRVQHLSDPSPRCASSSTTPLRRWRRC